MGFSRGFVGFSRGFVGFYRVSSRVNLCLGQSMFRGICYEPTGNLQNLSLGTVCFSCL